mmetsp:Transcript_6750/g.12684  ORF Transcript_6750/g.12684 Transcript_6750/m.12684 type:complete len:89 (-) Transcript_6750:225-491(-)
MQRVNLALRGVRHLVQHLLIRAPGDCQAKEQQKCQNAAKAQDHHIVRGLPFGESSYGADERQIELKQHHAWRLVIIQGSAAWFVRSDL